MLNCFVTDVQNPVLPISVVSQQQFSMWLEAQSPSTKEWLAATHFKAEPGNTRLIPDQQGRIQRVICCVSTLENLWNVGHLPFTLPEGVYNFDGVDEYLESFAIAWGLGAYQFTRYKKPTRQSAQLVLPLSLVDAVSIQVESINMVRDWVNTPTDDMGPTEFSMVARQLASSFKAEMVEIIGDDLLRQNYASIYTVGRASDDAPRLVDIRWGNPKHPKVTLVGKGVCFDSGGLDIKSAPYMLLMKKDMAGGAHVLGLARMIMQANLPVRLRVLVPMVENAIAGNAYRPGDVIISRKGLSIEIGNTDAEGRVILADALTEAVAEKPDLLIDVTTLTGAARVALGTELPAVFSNNDAVVNELMRCGEQLNDPMWRLPLFALYRDALNSPIADINNSSTDSYAGAIVAALFLKEFVPDDIAWLHFDLMAWNLKTRPGRPQGGEAMALRALFAYLQQKYT